VCVCVCVCVCVSINQSIKIPLNDASTTKVMAPLYRNRKTANVPRENVQLNVGTPHTQKKRTPTEKECQVNQQPVDKKSCELKSDSVGKTHVYRAPSSRDLSRLSGLL
jgi:hypothetical protein